MYARMRFDHVRIDDRPPCGRLGFCLTPDLTGNGRPDILVGGMGRAYPMTVGRKRIKLRQLPVAGPVIKRREWNVFWYENPGWERHDVARTPDLSVGGSLGDLDGDGLPELIVGENNGSNLFWFDPPADPRDPWERHLITDAFQKYHDTLVTDVDGDGEPEVLLLSQHSRVVCYYDIPEEPRQSPWPSSMRETIADGLDVEGVGVSDLDKDGQVEVIAGPNVFSRNAEGWTRHAFADWEWTRIALGDLDGDGREEIVISEGDLPYQGDRPGQLGIVDPETWSVTVLEDELFCPHTLQIGDVTGNGRPDILVGEMGIQRHPDPALYLYCNDGDGGFDRVEIDRGIGTHEAKLVDLTGDGRLDIASKSYGPPAHVDVWLQRE